MQPRHQATWTQPLQCDLQPQIQHRGGTHYVRNAPSRNRRTHEVPFIAGCNHFNYSEKYKVSCSGFLPKTKPMQHSCSHYNTFRSITWLTRMYLHTWQHQMTTIMQPLQCDLQPQIQETHRTTHIDTTTCCRTQRRNEPIRDRNDRSRNRRTHEVPLIAGCNHFTRKNTEGFVLRLPPRNKAHATFIHAAITIRFAASRG